MNLRAILLGKIDHYLANDNPEKKEKPEASFWEKAQNAAVSLFSAHGEEGRARAISYRRFIETTPGDDNLLKLVVADVNQSREGRLDTSNKVRLYMMQGLCEFFGITETQIKTLMEQSRVQAAFSAGAYYAEPPEFERRKSAMLDLINRRFENTRRQTALPRIGITDTDL